MEIVIGLVIGLLAGVGVGYLVRKTAAEREVGSAESRARTLLQDATKEAEATKREALVEAKDEIFRLRNEAEAEIKARRAEIEKRKDRIAQRESVLDSRADSLDRKEGVIEAREAELVGQRDELATMQQRARGEIERISGMTSQDAKQLLIDQIAEDAKRDAMVLVRDIEAQAREEAEKRARKLIAIAMQRVASELTTESTVTTMTLPNEDLHEKSTADIEREIREAGEWAVLETGITDLHPELVRVLGRLKFRTSYGQNVLKHVVEASHISGMVAS